MKLIEQYQKSGKLLEEQLLGCECSVKKVVELQELKYRISVLSTMRMFEGSAPIDGTLDDIAYHFRILTKYIGFLIEERKMGKKTDEAGQKKRKTAAEALESVFESKKEEYEEYDFEENPSTYMKFVNGVICTVIPAWVQYRDSYIDVSKLPIGEEKAGKAEKTEKKPVSEEDEVKKSMAVACPLSRFKGKTLGEVLREEPEVLTYLAVKGADKYKETHPQVVKAAKILCEYAKKKSKRAEEDAA